MTKPISQPCLRNQEPIFQVLQQQFTQTGTVLELACGTAQHAVYLTQQLPHLCWQATDMLPALPGANAWIKEAQLPNLLPAIELDVSQTGWGNKTYDYVYSANFVHFVSPTIVKSMFAGIEQTLNKNGLLALYGPYNNQGFTSDGNAQLDRWLKQDIHPEAGIKELADITKLASNHRLELIENFQMPANNYLLIFKRL